MLAMVMLGLIVSEVDRKLRRGRPKRPGGSFMNLASAGVVLVLFVVACAALAATSSRRRARPRLRTVRTSHDENEPRRKDIHD
jgi:hypothetical protein